MPPRVSVITVVRDGVAHLGQTMDSVLAQRDVDLEYIVIDGGSTDGSVDVIRRHEGRLANWSSEPDQGIADAFNKGLDRARGEYVMFLNADDHLAHPQALSGLVDFARARSWPEVVYGDTELLDPATAQVLYRSSIPFSPARFVDAGTLPHAAALTHRRYFERHGRFDTSYRVAMDYEMFLRGVPECGAEHVPFLVSRVRLGGVSARNRRWVVDETVRALRTHGYLSAAGALRLRVGYGLRGASRRVLEALGLYGALLALRRVRGTAAAGGRER